MKSVSIVSALKLQWVFAKFYATVWLSLWVTKIIVHFLPRVFQFFAGVISSGTRKYSLIIRALEIPLSLVGWAATSLATFVPLMTLNPDQKAAGDTATKHWQSVVRNLLVAALVSACILLAEKFLVQLISINYHRKQFNMKIKDSKRNIYLLGLLYDASRALFPMYCNEFAEEDYIIGDDLGLLKGKKGHVRSGSATPMRLLQDVGRFGDKITSVFGNVAKEITGKQILNPNAAHSIVTDALEKTRSSEALARRIWMSFVVEGKDALYQEDIVEVLGTGRETEAIEAFGAIDRDGNGDISLDEMVLTVTEFGRERKSIASSMHDVDQAINVLDGLLSTVVFVICIFVIIAFLNASFVTTLATAGTALLSLSFVFAATAQEVLGSCIFLFVKHPYDIGDRVDLNSAADQLTVEHISLLFTVFKRVNTGKMVQIPNIVLNNLWVENVSRSKAMREQLSVFCAFDTPFEDIQALKHEMEAFVVDKENNRDFQSDVQVECVGIAEMNKLELRIEIRHKSNWSNEAVRAARRSKFMCALVLALRKVPIYAPGGGDAGLGSAGQPSYSVAVGLEQAQAMRDKFTKDKDAKRIMAAKKEEPTQGVASGVEFGSPEYKAIDRLNTRAPGYDPARDDTWNARDDGSTIGRPSTDRPDLEEVRGLLHKQSVAGKRKQDPNALSPTLSPSINASASRDYGATRSTSLSQRQVAATQPQVPLTPSTVASMEEDMQRRAAQPLRMHSLGRGAPTGYGAPATQPPTIAPPAAPLGPAGNAFAAQESRRRRPSEEDDYYGPSTGGQYRPYEGA